jgi:hypothetical protein
VRVLGDVVIYPCIDISYGLIEHLKVEKVLKFNPTKGLNERYNFTQSNEQLKL